MSENYSNSESVSKNPLIKSVYSDTTVPEGAYECELGAIKTRECTGMDGKPFTAIFWDFEISSVHHDVTGGEQVIVSLMTSPLVSKKTKFWKMLNSMYGRPLDTKYLGDIDVCWRLATALIGKGFQCYVELDLDKGKNNVTRVVPSIRRETAPQESPLKQSPASIAKAEHEEPSGILDPDFI